MVPALIGRVALVVIVALAGSCTPVGPPRGERAAAPARAPSDRWGVEAMCRLPPAHLLRTRRGYVAGRSGEVQFVPRSPNYFGERSHSGPWAYLQRVPLLWYGPGHVPAGRTSSRSVTLADVAPTIAAHLGIGLPDAQGSALAEAIASGPRPPRLVVVVIWDGGGQNVLREHPEAWPVLRRLKPRGTWFARATVGSSPSVSPAVHGTLSTGVFPARHGVADMVLRRGASIEAVADDPRLLRARTLGDRFDLRMGNRPIVGLVGHPLILSVVGQGSSLPGADRDLAMIEGESGWTPPEGGARFFRFPAYAADVPGLGAALDRLDRRDGEPDGAWRDTPLDEIPPSVTPAFAELQTRLIEEVIRREGMGADRIPDLLYVNYNQINEVGHHWGMNSPQMADAVRSSDRALGELARLLDSRVGRGRWLLVMTADHGSTPDASVSGGFAMDQDELARDLRAEFDRDGDGRSAIQEVRVTQLWADQRELRESGATVADVAWFLDRYTEGQNRPDVAPDERDERVFDAAFPSRLLRSGLNCQRG